MAIDRISQLKESDRRFWQEYVEHNDIRVGATCKVEAAPAGNFEITDALIELYEQGKKTAGSSLVEDFEATGDPLPAYGMQVYRSYDFDLRFFSGGTMFNFNYFSPLSDCKVIRAGQ